MNKPGLRGVLLALCLVIGVLATILTSRTPQPQGAGAAADAFSAVRAMSDDRIIAVRPHPEGSPEAQAARDYIFGRMAALGLNPRRTRGEAVEAPAYFHGALAVGGAVENLIGVLPGRDPLAPAIVLMAHSDSVPGSPGAADDGAGVISALEVVRALKAAGPHRRGVIVLITDGEEAGLLGARAFFASGDPLLKHIGMIVNMEARGGGGRVAMFETGADNGPAMALFAKAVKNADALSLMSEVYKYMPNSTDFTVAKAAGFAGYNLAFAGEEFDYHSPSSTPAALDQGSVQHMGDQALALAKAMADADALPGRGPSAIYGDVLGGPVIAYPPMTGWAILALCAVLAAVGATMGARRSGERLGVVDVLRGAGAVLCGLTGAMLILHLANQLLAGDLVRSRNLLAQFDLLFAGVAALTGGAALTIWSLAFRGRGRWGLIVLALIGGALSAALGGGDWFGLGLGLVTAALGFGFGRPLQPWSGWLGVALVGVLITLALQLVGPPLTVATAWPLLIGTGAMVLVAALGGGAFGAAAAALAAAVLGAVAAAQLGHLASPIFVAIGADMPEAMALIPLLAAFALYPLLEGWSRTWAGRFVGVALAVLGASALLVCGLRDPATARTPRPVQAFYLDDAAGGHAWLASTLSRLDPWSKTVLAQGGAARRQAMTPLFDKLWLAPASPVALTRPTFQASTAPQTGGRIVTIAIAPHDGGRELRLYLQPSAPIAGVTVNGQAADLVAKPGQWAQLRWVGATAPLTLRFTAKRPGTLDLRYEAITAGWPAGLSAPPKPATDMPWGFSDDTVLTDRFMARW